MSTIKHESANHYIIASGAVFTFKQDPLTIEFNNKELNSSEKVNFKLEVHFLEDSEKGKEIKSEVMGSPPDEYLKIEIYNVVVGNGGLTKPFLIADNKETKKKTYLNLSFEKFNKDNDSILCNYTIYIEK